MLSPRVYADGLPEAGKTVGETVTRCRVQEGEMKRLLDGSLEACTELWLEFDIHGPEQ